MEDAGRQALTELRTMLSVLREGRDDEPALAPQPDVAHVPVLVEHLRSAGLTVRLRVAGDPAPMLPAGVALSAYRIVQEALTNVLTHAPGAHAWVDIVYTDEVLRLEVRNDAPPVPGMRSDGNGRGLIGMRERLPCMVGSQRKTRRSPGIPSGSSSRCSA